MMHTASSEVVDHRKSACQEYTQLLSEHHSRDRHFSSWVGYFSQTGRPVSGESVFGKGIQIKTKCNNKLFCAHGEVGLSLTGETLNSCGGLNANGLHRLICFGIYYPLLVELFGKD